MRIPEGGHRDQVVGCHSLPESLLLSLLWSTQSCNSSTVMTTTDSRWPVVMSPLCVYSAQCILLSSPSYAQGIVRIIPVLHKKVPTERLNHGPGFLRHRAGGRD